jgi:hypothetical protein
MEFSFVGRLSPRPNRRAVEPDTEGEEAVVGITEC